MVRNLHEWTGNETLYFMFFLYLKEIKNQTNKTKWQQQQKTTKKLIAKECTV